MTSDSQASFTDFSKYIHIMIHRHNVIYLACWILKSGWSFYSGYIYIFKILLACTHEKRMLLFSWFCLSHSNFKTHNPIREVTQHVPYLWRPSNSPDIPGQLFCHLAKLVSGGTCIATSLTVLPVRLTTPFPFRHLYIYFSYFIVASTVA